MFGMTFGKMGALRTSGGQFVLDQIAAATAAAYSTRRLSGTYYGPALRVRRSSDSVEADIGFNADGTLNETALLAHVGANSGFVSKYYDQSGNGRDMAQATAASQPRIVNAGVVDRFGTCAAVRTDGVAQAMASSAFTLPQPFTRSSVLQFLNPAASGSHAFFDSASPAGVVALFTSAPGTLSMYANSLQADVRVGVAANDKATVAETFNGASSTFSYNGSSTAAATGNGSLVGLALAQDRNAANLGTALFGDVILFPIALDPTTRANLEANQKQFWGTP